MLLNVHTTFSAFELPEKLPAFPRKQSIVCLRYFSLNMLLVYPVKKTCTSPTKYSGPFAATLAGALADFQGNPLSTFQSNPESASKLKSSQPLLGFTHWSQNGYTNVNTIVIFSSVLLEHIFHFNFFFVRHWLLCNTSHCTVRVNKGDSL